jgi:methylmalonyl-CoA epimerase
MEDVPVCRAEHLNHVCIAVKDIESTLDFYKSMFGITSSGVENIEDQGVKAALVRVGGSQLEFIQPTDKKSGVARFIENRGESVHHICFEVDDLQGKLDKLDEEGVRLIDKKSREGLSGMIGFVHPSETAGILYELVDRETAKR